MSCASASAVHGRYRTRTRTDGDGAAFDWSSATRMLYCWLMILLSATIGCEEVGVRTLP